MSTDDKAALLASLREIREPPAPEPGWPWLIIAIALGLALLIVLWKNRPRKAASIATQQINAARLEPPAQALVRLARLLRSKGVNHKKLANPNTHGDAWLQALNKQFNTTFFTTGHGRVFGNDLYQKAAADIDIDMLCNQLQQLFDGKQIKALA